MGGALGLRQQEKQVLLNTYDTDIRQWNNLNAKERSCVIQIATNTVARCTCRCASFARLQYGAKIRPRRKAGQHSVSKLNHGACQVAHIITYHRFDTFATATIMSKHQQHALLADVIVPVQQQSISSRARNSHNSFPYKSESRRSPQPKSPTLNMIHDKAVEFIAVPAAEMYDR